MLKVFFPSEYHESVFDIDYELLKSKGYIGLMFDIDNTLVPFDELDANSNIIELFTTLKNMGFEICLVSNNNRKRVYRFNQKLKVHAIYNALKPLRRKLRKGMEFLGTDSTNTVFVGDQMFTDVFVGNRLKMKTILIKPIQNKEQLITKIKRSTEKQLFKYYMKRTNKDERN